MTSTRGPLLAAATIGLMLAAGGCLDPAAGARGSCAAQDVDELRCRAIVADATRRMPPDSPPVIGAEVIVATPDDRDTLLEQQLVATVRFSFLDGSAADVPVFCGPRQSATLLCTEPGS